MKIDYAAVLKLLEKLVKVEEKITKEIKKEKDAKKRKKLQAAIDKRDTAAVHDLWFDM